MGSKYSVKITKSALNDLELVYIYILETSFSKEIATKIKEEIVKEIFSLELFPKKNIKIDGFRNIRRLLVYSYALLYRIEEEKREVTILRILSNYTDWH